MFVIAVLDVIVMFYAWAGGVNVGMLVGVNVDATVVERATPWTVVDEDGVTAPTKASAVPTIDSEGGPDSDGWAEANCRANDESATGREEDNRGAVHGNVIVGRVDGLDFDITAIVYDCVIWVGS